MADVKLVNVSKIYEGKTPAVKDVNISVSDKEFLVLVGPSGCGKSTTLRMIAGLEEITSGEIYIDNKLVNDISPKDRDIAMVFQNYALYPHMTVFENMAFGLKLRKFKKDDIKKRVNEAARILQLESYLDRKPKALSGGQRQRVALGRAIVRHPKVFLFDEPLSNLDAKLRVQMRTEIAKLHKQLEATIIYVTHDQTEAMTMGDRIVLMKDGIVQQVDTPLHLYKHPANKFTAGFIGSPPMNFIEGTIRNDKQLLFKSKDDFLTINLPASLNSSLSNCINSEVTMGIRPEDILLEPGNASSVQKFDAEIEVAEQMGNETYLYFKSGTSQLIGRVRAIEKPEPGTPLNLYFNLDKLHFFSKEEEAIS